MSLAVAQQGFLAMILAPAPPAAEEGRRVYHHAYRARLMGALSETYERVWTWLGDDAFHAEARAYIEQHPSTNWTLDAYGLDFPAFLDARFPNDPEIAELAWLDAELRQAFAAPDAETLDPAALATITSWEAVRLRLNPALRHRAVRTNAAALWRALSRADTPPDIVYFTDQELTGLCVWKLALEPRFRTLDADEYHLVHALNTGLPFAAACEALAHDHPDTDPTHRVGEWLGGWIAEGLVIGFDLDLTEAAASPLSDA